jgi:colanic acid biosynthesis glycosyl transferase WcaI
MRALLLSNYFPPEIGTGPNLPFEIGEWLVQAGHDVAVVTGFPRYNLPVMPARYRGRMLYREQMAGMEVYRINAPNFYGTTGLSRGLVQVCTPPALALRSLPVKHPDVVLTDIPPIFLGIAARLIGRRFRVPSVAYVMDLFPQTIVDAGLLRNRHLIRFFEMTERYIYRSMSALAVISEGYREHVVKRGADPRKVSVVPTWADLDAIRPGERLNAFRTTRGLGSEFVVLFAGTMGFFQDLGTVIEAARRLAGEPGLVFLMVGGGAERGRLEEQAKGLSNVRFLPMQPKEVYPQVLAACDVALVTLHPGLVTPTVPSKIMTIMASGRPLIACLPPMKGRDAERCIAEADCGIVVPAGDASALASAVLQMKRDRHSSRRMGDCGRAYAEKRFSRSTCLSGLAGVLEKLTGPRPGSCVVTPGQQAERARG